ncbi:hypothetical protein Hypma_010629 [Hypsizygus marmoreus]|uniref:SWIM-type domain-containing protein n=1 Tax=Hypsizygus marmoreus TaxID=39966 RepID=A0A369JNZ7_HYPMA|nr:hypothetical protein Hypma_010629 [Hypsizygus marmoreus]
MPPRPAEHSKRLTSLVTIESTSSTCQPQRTSLRTTSLIIREHEAPPSPHRQRQHRRMQTVGSSGDTWPVHTISRSRSMPLSTVEPVPSVPVTDSSPVLQDAVAVDGLLDIALDDTAHHTVASYPQLKMCTETDEAYWYALEKLGGIFRVDSREFVLQDWDSQSESLEIGVYFHIINLPRGPSETGTACTCPPWKAHHICTHHRILHDHLVELMAYPILAPAPTPPAIFLCTTPFRNTHIFSCISSVGRYESSKRVIVSLQRDGRWHCQSCRFSESCKHKGHAVAFALQAGFVSDSSESSQGVPAMNESSADLENALLMHAGGRNDGAGKRGCISHLPILPPRWCSLPSETAYTAPRPICVATEFPLDNTARCCCGTSIDIFPDLDRFSCLLPTRQTAILFSLTYRLDVTIEVIPCPICRHWRRLIGSDLSTFGVFNWNNSQLFTHELLNAFTNTFTASETPFSAFCLTVRRSYEDHSTTMNFCSDETFVRAWFAFVQLQDLDSKMACPTCGPCPSLIVADGVSLATHTTKLTPNVRPPTWIDQNSEVIESISSYKARALPAIIQRDIRTAITKFLDATQPSSTEIPESIDMMKVSTLYASVMGLISISIDQHTPLHHRKNYRALLRQIAAPDIVLQLVPHSAINLLQIFSDTGDAPEWLQSLCPAFGIVLNGHRNDGTSIPLELMVVAGWLAGRAVDVYSRLAQHDPADPSQPLPQEIWNQTGTYYGLPAIRTRRTYRKLRYDAQPQELDAEEMGDCNKFYKTYSRNGLTGGILVLWCTHSICLGFHTIPVAEGRNDVFSAVYTRFRQAPEVIVYDFACQLAPYCLVREARYFRDTRFYIDELHAHDHTRCGQACFASNAMRFDERIRSVNTSAAECGNKGIKRIRKTVSYMIHEHAVIFTKAFLDVWNRTVIRRMLDTKV